MNYFLSSTIYEHHFDSPSGNYIGCIENESPELINLTQDILDNHTIIIFESASFVEYCRKRNFSPPANLIDIFQLFKLIYGIPEKFHKYSEWKLMYVILSKYVDQGSLKQIMAIVDSSMDMIVATGTLSELFTLNTYLQHVYHALMEELVTRGEQERFNLIEKPFNAILCDRQYKGIVIQNNLWHVRMDKIKTELNYVNKRLRFEHNIFNPKNIYEVKQALNKEKYQYLQRTLRTKSFWEFIKTGSDYNELLELLYTSYRLSYDKSNLAMMLVEQENLIYPQFDGLGTITARALVRRPFIQQLKKSSRDIFMAKEGYTLIYADYAQFEPGILASLADDKELIECYNSNDLYSSLSQKIFDSDQHRPFCKTLFLSFMYGMSHNGLELLISDFFPGDSNMAAHQINQFFQRFTNLQPYKAKLEAQALNEQKVCSCLGNHRYFKSSSKDRLSNKVKRWILSQKIQGTASLILKTAILNCVKGPEIEFLLPMHDAALFQVPSDNVAEKKDIIASHFKNAFIQYCPAIIPKVSFKSFVE